MRNKPEIQKAIELYLDTSGLKAAELAEALEITPASLSKIRSGKTKNIKHENWLKLEKVLTPYLPVNDRSDLDQSIKDFLKSATDDDKRAIIAVVNAMKK